MDSVDARPRTGDQTNPPAGWTVLSPCGITLPSTASPASIRAGARDPGGGCESFTGYRNGSIHGDCREQAGVRPATGMGAAARTNAVLCVETGCRHESLRRK